jgi:hypothetical protein
VTEPVLDMLRQADPEKAAELYPGPPLPELTPDLLLKLARGHLLRIAAGADPAAELQPTLQLVADRRCDAASLHADCVALVRTTPALRGDARACALAAGVGSLVFAADAGGSFLDTRRRSPACAEAIEFLGALVDGGRAPPTASAQLARALQTRGRPEDAARIEALLDDAADAGLPAPRIERAIHARRLARARTLARDTSSAGPDADYLRALGVLAAALERKEANDREGARRFLDQLPDLSRDPRAQALMRLARALREGWADLTPR